MYSGLWYQSQRVLSSNPPHVVCLCSSNMTEAVQPMLKLIVCYTVGSGLKFDSAWRQHI